MRSPLECIAGEYDHAIFATYSLNLRFFEDWVLPLLRSVGARNVVVLADEEQLGAALRDRSVRSVGRSYHAVSVRLGPGAFHPKVLMLAGEKGSRACVSSANLTVDGQLRNVESAIVLDSATPVHRGPLIEIAGFLRAVTSRAAPPHTADAVMAALAAIDGVSEDRPPSPFRVVSNLDEPLINAFPAEAMTAVTAYADSGEAAGVLSRNGQLTVVTDARSFSAPAPFFAGDWRVEARDFEKRRLHGKAYWTASAEGQAGWLLVGSPNLSGPALLRVAHRGNTELAVIVSPQEHSLGDLPGVAADADAMREAAIRRAESASVGHAATDADGVGSFNAWEDDGSIRIEGLADGTLIEHWDAGRWAHLGEVLDARLIPPPDVRPYLIRAVSPAGVVRQAVVHRTSVLVIQRLKPRTVSRAAEVVTSLPLDLAGVQALEGVLRDLYLLGSLAENDDLADRAGRARETQEESTGGDLGEWMPARPEDEPRVPDLYRRAWNNTPDALLALIRGALRLEVDGANEIDGDEWGVMEESLDEGAAEEDIDAQGGSQDISAAPSVPVVPRSVLSRYRNSLGRLLERGSEFVRDVPNRDLADLGFLSVLRLHERIESSPVDVDGELTILIDTDELLRQKLALLAVYLARPGGSYLGCLATARIHLARCLAAKSAFTALEWESLEDIAFRFAGDLLADDTFVQEVLRDAGETGDRIASFVRPYAERASWEGVLVEAEQHMDVLDFGEEPLFWVSGRAWIDSLESSPAWAVAGYSAVAAFRDQLPCAVIVRNEISRSKHMAHALVCHPSKKRLDELFQRASDSAWLRRSYRPVTRGNLMEAERFGAEGLRQLGIDPSSYAEVGTSTRSGAELLQKLGFARASAAVASPRSVAP